MAGEKWKDLEVDGLMTSSTKQGTRNFTFSSANNTTFTNTSNREIQIAMNLY